MLKALPLILASSAFLAACVTQPYTASSLATDLNTMQKQIAKLETKLSGQFAVSCSESLTELEAKIEGLKQAKETTKIVERCSLTGQDYPLANLDGKLLIGEIETIKVTLGKESFSLAARIDSGAVTSSIGVFNPQNFERDGDKWIRFAIAAGEDAEIYEYSIYDTVSIKQTKGISEERIEIKTDIEVGGTIYKNQIFNLSDRSHLDYQLLIGRSFLKDIAVIDVGSKFLLEGQ